MNITLGVLTDIDGIVSIAPTWTHASVLVGVILLVFVMARTIFRKGV